MKYGNLYVCRTPWLLDHLRLKGFIPIKVSADKYNPKHLVWIFENSPELEAAADKFIENNKNRI